jgi:hypothetical protein
MKLISALVFICASFLLHAGPDCDEPFFIIQKQRKVVFGSTVNVKIANSTQESANWKLLDGSGNAINQGVGNETGAIVCSIPGIYKVVFAVRHSETHLPHIDTAIIEVVSQNLIFQVDNAILNGVPKKSMPINNVTITMPVVVQSFDNSSILISTERYMSTGIPGLYAFLSSPVELSPGTHQLTFQLLGHSKHSGNAQIGFFNQLGEGYFYNFIIAE